MREWLLTGPRRLELVEYDDPPLADNEVRVRSLVTGVKRGTEMTLYRGVGPMHTKTFDLDRRAMVETTGGPPPYPRGLGSWGVGEVIAVGRAVTRYRAGDLVHGNSRHRPTVTYALDAAGERIGPVGGRHLRPLPPGLDPVTALFCDPAMFALSAVHDARIKVGDAVAVFGMGAIGLLAVQSARLQGADPIIAVDLVPERLALATTYGATHVLGPDVADPGLAIKEMTPRAGVDVALEISGSYAALQAAIRSVQAGGTVVTLGYYPGTGGEALRLGEEWHHNRVQLLSSMIVWGNAHRDAPLWDETRVVDTVERLLQRGTLRVSEMVTQRLPYARAPEAYALYDEHPDQAIKIVLEY
ncbi:MAG: zinc-binding dehydrogenase [Chloroflexi bacterium]|nr:zinc-binding dehydrogenase [Chloroflexota bacterium]